jgi:hypothetical protein
VRGAGEDEGAGGDELLTHDPCPMPNAQCPCLMTNHS